MKANLPAVNKLQAKHGEERRLIGGSGFDPSKIPPEHRNPKKVMDALVERYPSLSAEGRAMLPSVAAERRRRGLEA